jgi:ABC-type multidrug transport system permease subunit
MKTIRIFLRDLKMVLRQFVTLWLIIVPVILAFIIGAATPGVTDTPIRIAMLNGDHPEQVLYLEQFAAVELFDTIGQIEARVKDRDDVPAIIPDGKNGYVILTQGNEPEAIITAVKTFMAYWEQNIQAEPSRVTFHDFGRAAPPLKIMLITTLVILVTILSGMIIATNIVEEKSDRTIRAIRTAPVSVSGFVVGKSLIGVFSSLVCTALCVLAAGFGNINFLQVLLVAFCASFVSFLVGFMVGLTSDDFISAMASLKLLMIPAVAPILAIELLSDKWQWPFFWSPFYWAYDGVKGVLAQTIQWSAVWRDAGLVAVISFVVYLMLYPKIKQKMR